MRRSKKNERVPPETYRVIKISGDAAFEFLHESMKDHLEQFFDVSDVTSIVTSFAVDWKTGALLMIARNKYDDEVERLQFPDEIDTQQLLLQLPDTVKSMYNGKKRYKDLSLGDIVQKQQQT